MTVIHLVEHNLMLAFRAFGDPPAKDVGDARSGESGQTKGISWFWV
jgi:hypothetical protein